MYDDASICVDGVKTLSYSCGTYLDPPVTSLCVAQETYSANNSSQYALQLGGMYIDNFLELYSM